MAQTEVAQGEAIGRKLAGRERGRKREKREGEGATERIKMHREERQTRERRQ